MNDLPSGWVEARLSDVAEHVLGKMLDKQKNKGQPRPYLRNQSVRWGRFDLDDVKEMRITDEERERYRVRQGDVLVCEGGEPGRCAVWESDDEIYFQKALHRVRPSEALSPRFLAHFLRYAAANRLLDPLFTGSTIKHLPGEKLAQVTLPLPPPYEQDRIVDAIEQHRERIDYGANDVRFARELLPKLKAACLATAFDQSQGEVHELQDLATIQSGITKGPPKGTDLIPVPYIRTANVQAGFLELSEIKELHVTEEQRARHRLGAGDVLVLEGGDADKVGRGWIWDDEVPGAIHQNHVFAVRPDPDRLHSRYLAYYVNAPQARTYFMSKAKQTTNLASINKTQLRALPVPTPSIDRQAEITTRLDRELMAVGSLEEVIAERIREIDVLHRSLLAHAFRGTLVPRDQREEPTSELRLGHDQAMADSELDGVAT